MSDFPAKDERPAPPLPLVGKGWGWGSGGRVLASMPACNLPTPLPTLPHKGGGKIAVREN
jgi:hypothetical protein